MNWKTEKLDEIGKNSVEGALEERKRIFLAEYHIQAEPSHDGRGYGQTVSPKSQPATAKEATTRTDRRDAASSRESTSRHGRDPKNEIQRGSDLFSGAWMAVGSTSTPKQPIP